MPSTVPRPPLPGPRTRFGPAFAAVYVGQLARARVARIPLLFVAAFQSVGIMLLLRGVVDTGSETTREQVVAGSTVLVVGFVALNLLAQRLGALKAAGGLDYYLTLPVPPASVVLGTAASYATFAVPGTLVTVLLGAGLYDLPLAHLWVLAPVVVLAGASLAGLGALVGLLAPRPELATVAGQLGMSAVLFLGIIPAERMPEALRVVRAIVPSTYAVDALAESFRRHVDLVAVLVDLLICAAVAAASLALGSAALRWAGGPPVTGGFGVPPLPERPAHGLRPALVTFAATALGGVPLGLLWAAFAPHLDLPAALGGSEAAFETQAGVDVWFGFLALLAGLVAGVVTWWRARDGGWPVPVALTAGGVVGSLLASWIGDLLRADAISSKLPSGVDPVLADRVLNFHLRATGVYLVYPLAATALFAIGLWVTGRSAGRTIRNEPADVLDPAGEPGPVLGR